MYVFCFSLTLLYIQLCNISSENIHAGSGYGKDKGEIEACEIALKTPLQSKLDTVSCVSDIIFKYVNSEVLVPNTSSVLLYNPGMYIYA